jgi:hypothetical protein
MSPTTARRFALVAVCALGLTACSLNPFASEPSPIPTASDGRAGQPLPADAYPGPGTATVPAATTVAPAPQPTTAAAQPTAPAGQQPLVGPEWTILASGDLNADGRPDVVGIKLAQGVTPDATFRQPGYAAYKGPAAEMVIVQAGGDGRPQIQTALTRTALSSGSGTLASFSGASGFMVNVTPGTRPLVTIWPLSSAGAPLGRAVALEWSSAAATYVLFAGAAK